MREGGRCVDPSSSSGGATDNTGGATDNIGGSDADAGGSTATTTAGSGPLDNPELEQACMEGHPAVIAARQLVMADQAQILMGAIREWRSQMVD